MDYDDDVPVASRPSILVQSPKGTESWVSRQPIDDAHHHADENTPLNPSVLPPPLVEGSYGGTTHSSAHHTVRPGLHNAHISSQADETFFSGGHHRHETRDSHHKHHVPVSRWSWFRFPWASGEDAPPLDAAAISRLPSMHSLNSGRRGTMRSQATRSYRQQPSHTHSDGHEHAGRPHAHAHADMEQWMNGMEDRHNGAARTPADEECGSDLDDEEVKIGRRRQVIGILVSICAFLIISGGPDGVLGVANGYHDPFAGDRTHSVHRERARIQ